MNLSFLALSASKCLQSPLVATNERVRMTRISFSLSAFPALLSYSCATIYSSSFSNLLSCGLYFSGGQSMCARYSSFSASTNITDCMFSSLSGNPYGGAIYITSSYAIRVYRCLFNSCLSLYDGGGIYGNTGKLTVDTCCFSMCYTTNVMDDTYHGNAIYFTGSNVTVTKSMYTLCGPSIASGADGTLYLTTGFIILSHNNATNNKGTTGAMDGDLYSFASGSIFEYESLINTNGTPTVFDFRNGASAVLYCANFANITDSSTYGLIFLISQTLLVSGCVFKGNTNSLTVVSTSSTITFTNCVADINSASFTYSAVPTTLSIGLYFPQGCSFTLTSSFTDASASFKGSAVTLMSFVDMLSFLV